MGEPTSKGGGTVDAALSSSPETGDSPAGTSRSGVVFPRLLIGLVILICAEVFSGASIQVGLWNPWTWVVTYWLYSPVAPPTRTAVGQRG
jgi:hypothetical protein